MKHLRIKETKNLLWPLYPGLLDSTAQSPSTPQANPCLIMVSLLVPGIDKCG
jgi:hypothetical protein